MKNYFASVAYGVAGLSALTSVSVLQGNDTATMAALLAFFFAWLSAWLGDGVENGIKSAAAPAVISLVGAVICVLVAFASLAVR
jgi:hypothetical protein